MARNLYPRNVLRGGGTPGPGPGPSPGGAFWPPMTPHRYEWLWSGGVYGVDLEMDPDDWVYTNSAGSGKADLNIEVRNKGLWVHKDLEAYDASCDEPVSTSGPKRRAVRACSMKNVRSKITNEAHFLVTVPYVYAAPGISTPPWFFCAHPSSVVLSDAPSFQPSGGGSNGWGVSGSEVVASGSRGFNDYEFKENRPSHKFLGLTLVKNGSYTHTKATTPGGITYSTLLNSVSSSGGEVSTSIGFYKNTRTVSDTVNLSDVFCDFKILAYKLD